MGPFILPSSPTLCRQDRFDVTGSGEFEVRFWDILNAILRDHSGTNSNAPPSDVSSLIDVLETISVSLHGSSTSDYGFLREFWASHFSPDDNTGTENLFFRETWPVLVRLALETPSLFPDGRLPFLSASKADLPSENEVFTSVARLSRRQVACLAIHQFLCSLPLQPWHTESFVDLRVWYSSSSGTRHQGAVHAYLTALFTYFDRLKPSRDGQQSYLLSYAVEDWPISFALVSLTPKHTGNLISSLKECPLTTLEVPYLPQPSIVPDLLGLSDGACVISANKCFGYGPTGTQEELHVGITPEAYPAVLFAQPLGDKHVLIVQGAETMVSIKGYGRDAALDQVLEPDYGSKASPCESEALISKWQHRTMLFMDALELDTFTAQSGQDETGNDQMTSLPDLLPGHIHRDLIKSYTAFSSNVAVSASCLPYAHIVTGLWGCGTFGGNRYIKTLIQWCAASLAGTPRLVLVLAGKDQEMFGYDVRGLVTALQKIDRCISVGDVLNVLTELGREMKENGGIHTGATQIFEHLLRELMEKR
jgi:poly(ADP-ribose) glycohydrolase